MRILIADDHDLLRDTMREFLDHAATDIDVVGVATLEDAVTALQGDDAYNLVLLDYNMPGMNGLEGLDRAKDAANGAHVAVISGVAQRAVADEALARGAVGFLPKTISAKSMVHAVRMMADGERYVPFEFLTETSPGNEAAEAGLTQRELQVLQGLAEGLANKEIARDLNLQEVTIKLHVKTLCRKLDARNRTHAAMIGRERGLI